MGRLGIIGLIAIVLLSGSAWAQETAPPIAAPTAFSSSFEQHEPKAPLMRFALITVLLAVSNVITAEDLAPRGAVRKDIPDKLVVLTFDDSAKSHHTFVRPLLKQYGFGATFFITEGFDFPTNKKDYMTWEQIRELHDDGFEIGNHTRDHLGISDKTVDRLPEQLEAIAEKCRLHGIPAPITFAWPGNAMTPAAFATLNKQGIVFARRGGSPEYPYDEGRGFAYEPGLDHPLMVPSAGDGRPKWTLPDFIRAVEQARNGRVAVLQFHGVPDTAHSWVSSNQQNFEAYMKYLKVEGYRVIALRDLREFVDPAIVPSDYRSVIESRREALKEQSKE
jgi:peptidoglycan/xylan/chitin deacetylase (PgdA/CDA1 family)